MLSRDLATPGERTRFFANARKGEFVAICRGAYVRADVWNRLDRHARYRARIKAAAALAPAGLVFSNQSAAAMWRLPWVGEWPTQVHVFEPSAPGGRSNSMLVRHTLGIPDGLVQIEGMTVTSIGRTVVDVARTGSFGQAVTVADAALRRTEHPIDAVPGTFLTRRTWSGNSSWCRCGWDW